MRRLQLLVLFESLTVLVLGLLWLDSAQAAPGDALPPPTTPVVGEVESRSANRESTRRERDTAAPARRVEVETTTEAAGGVGIVVHGKLLVPPGAEPPEQIGIGFRRTGVYRGGTVTAGSHYAVAGLAPGTWEVSVRAKGFARYAEEHTFGTSSVQVLDLPLQPAHIVKVFLRTPDGGRLAEKLAEAGVRRPGLTVIVTEAPLLSDLPPTDNTTVGDVGVGRYESTQRRGKPDPDAPDGELQLDRAPPLHAALLMRHVVVARQPIGEGQQQLTFEVDVADLKDRLGTVRVQILDGPTGEPITDGLWMSLNTAQGGGTRAQPDAEGLVVASVPPGLVSMLIRGKNRESRWDLLRVRSGRVLELGTMYLHPPVQLKGRLIGPGGEPVSGSVQWTNLATMTYPRELIDRRSTSADGGRRLHAAWRGPAPLRVARSLARRTPRHHNRGRALGLRPSHRDQHGANGVDLGDHRQGRAPRRIHVDGTRCGGRSGSCAARRSAVARSDAHRAARRLHARGTRRRRRAPQERAPAGTQ